MPKKSTIVRSRRWFPQYGLIRAAFRALDPVAPGIAARWATRIWCTPPRPRRSRLHRPPAGTRFTVALPGGGPSNVVAEAWGDGPVVYLVHGWGGWRGQLTGLVAPLRAAGYRVVALDAPGHGESGPGRLGGRRTTLLEVAEALAAVAEVAGPAHAIVGHSGGASATALAVKDGLSADRLVFLAPMASPWSYFAPFTQALGLGARTASRVWQRTERLIGRPFADFDVPAWAGQPRQPRQPGLAGQAGQADDLPRLLVIHDRGDREVRYADGQAIADAWPGASLRTTEGLGHRRIVADPAVVDATVQFVTGVLATATAADSSRRS